MTPLFKQLIDVIHIYFNIDDFGLLRPFKQLSSGLKPSISARVMGSQGKRDAVLRGVTPESVVNGEIVVAQIDDEAVTLARRMAKAAGPKKAKY